MIRYLFFLLFGISVSASAQLLTKRLTPKQKTQEPASVSSIDQSRLPFWEDFSITEDGLPDKLRVWGSDTLRQWGDSTRGVYINSTLAINPPSYKVATFDGLDENGLVYADGRGLTDQLYSDTLDLSGYTSEDDIYLSFYWQAGGNVEPPDEKDSIRLQFYNQSVDQSGGEAWQTLWTNVGSEGMVTDIFFQEVINLDERFLDTTLFRFQTFGDQDGPFDAWHLDWIYMNANRGDDDFFYEDISLNSDISFLFGPFRSIPLEQFDRLDFSDVLSVSSMNLNFEPDNVGVPTDYVLRILDSESNTLLGQPDTSVVDTLTRFLNPDPFQITANGTVTFDNVNFSIPNSSKDSMVIEAQIFVESDTVFLDTTNINLLINDTISTQYLLHDFYAYDDGTAEYAVGTNQQGDQVGVQYWVNGQDTLTHVDIHFPNIEPDSDGETLILRIFRNLDDPLPLRSESITITTAGSQNEFTSYPLTRPAILSDTFYITYEQNVNQYISIGLDRSNSEASQYIFQNISGEWERNDRIEGALMIRPVFKDVDSLTLSVPEHNSSIKVYPNPTSGFISIEGNYELVELRNLSGQLLRRESISESHDFSGLPRGLYLLTIYNGFSTVTKKIILE